MPSDENEPEENMECLLDDDPSEGAPESGSTATSEPWKNLVVAVPGPRGRVHFGVVPEVASSNWGVWFSAYGSDPQPLSSWSLSEEADAAVSRYVVALSKGWQRLQEEVRRSPSIAGYRMPGEIPREARAPLRAVVAKQIS